jgi:hypothetical protein
MTSKNLDENHIYLSMTKLHVYQNLSKEERDQLLKDVLAHVEQQMRSELILTYRDHHVQIKSCFAALKSGQTKKLIHRK